MLVLGAMSVGTTNIIEYITKKFKKMEITSLLKQGRFLIILGVLPAIAIILLSTNTILSKAFAVLVILCIGALTFWASILAERFYKKKKENK